MDATQLAYLVAVVEERSFTGGAARVHVVQSAVSAAIGRLERELGATLIERGPRHFATTPAGQMVYEHALRVLGTLQNIRDDIAAAAAGLTGTVSIGVVFSTGDLDLPAVIRRFGTTHPRVEIRIVDIPGPVETRLLPVRDGSLDLALVPATHPIPDAVDFRPITAARVRLVAPPDDPLAHRSSVSLTELGDRPFVDFPRPWGNRGLIDAHFARHGVRRRVAVEVSDVATALAFVRGGNGMAFIAEDHLAPDLTLIDLADPPPDFTLGIARSAVRPATAAARHLHAALVGTTT